MTHPVPECRSTSSARLSWAVHAPGSADEKKRPQSGGDAVVGCCELSAEELWEAPGGVNGGGGGPGTRAGAELSAADPWSSSVMEGAFAITIMVLPSSFPSAANSKCAVEEGGGSLPSLLDVPRPPLPPEDAAFPKTSSLSTGPSPGFEPSGPTRRMQSA